MARRFIGGRGSGDKPGVPAGTAEAAVDEIGNARRIRPAGAIRAMNA